VDGNEFHSWEVLGMKEDLWDRVCGLGSVTWKGCEWEGLLVLSYLVCEDYDDDGRTVNIA